MDYLKDYTINFVGLSIGNHLFDFEVNDRFFEQFEYSQLKQGVIHVRVDLEKQDRIMVLSFKFDGYVNVDCDRCGEEFKLPLQGLQRLIIKFGAEFQEESEEMIIIPSTEFKIDIAPYIYEYLHLLLPSRIIHPDDAEGNTNCNPAILRRLEELAPHNSIDPRWAALVNLNQSQDPSEAENQFKQKKKKK